MAGVPKARPTARPQSAAKTDRYQRSNRVLVPRLAERVTLIGPEAHHLRDVLRLRPGATVEAFDGSGNEAVGVVVAADRGEVVLELGEAAPSAAEAAVHLTLAVALLKGDKLVDVVRPATELGVARFVLLRTAYTDANDISPARLARLERVAQEAARQCGRAVVPPVAGPIDIDVLTTEAATGAASARLIVADPRAQGRLTDVLAAQGDAGPDVAPVVAVTGPEGGLSGVEVEALVAAGAVAVGLGPRILRAETAPVALAAAVLLGAS